MKIKKFDLDKHWDDFLAGEFYVKCRSEELANEFLKYCHNKGLKWSSEESLLETNEWNYKYNTVGYKYEGADYGMVREDNPETNIEFLGFSKKSLGNTYIQKQQIKPPLGVMPKDIY